MTYRSSFSSIYGSGRASPYAPTRPAHDDRSFSDLYEYVGPGDVDPRGGGGRVSITNLPPSLENEDAPDIIHVRFMASSFHVEFPPFSISESAVLTGDLRRKVAQELGHDHRRIRLVYKDRDLRTDRHPIKHYGCKQNSEISVVITEHLSDHGNSSEEDLGARSSLQPSHNDRRRPRGNSSVRDRNDEYSNLPAGSGGMLHPLNGYSQSRRRSVSRDGGSRARSRSPGPPMSRVPAPQPSPSPTPSVQRSPPQSPADPNTPMGRVQALQNEYYDKWYPMSHAFIIAPPHDAQTREKEWMKLSESIMRHIIEAADAIELQGDRRARAERKKVLDEAQDMVKRLDAVGKPR